MASTQATNTTNTTTATQFTDPFATASEESDMFATTRRASDSSTTSDDGVPLSQRDRRLSKEWDAAKTPPSKFQRLPGSIFATPSSRDGHVARNKIHGFKEKVKELSGGKK